MPHRKVVFERWQVVLIFCILVFSFVIMGILLKGNIDRVNENSKQRNNDRKEQIALIQRSRIESCQTTYQLIQDLIDLNVNAVKSRQGGKLNPRQAEFLEKYYARLDPTRCVKIITPPKAKPKEKK